VRESIDNRVDAYSTFVTFGEDARHFLDIIFLAVQGNLLEYSETQVELEKSKHLNVWLTISIELVAERTSSYTTHDSVDATSGI
jgi:hypothetical protein